MDEKGFQRSIAKGNFIRKISIILEKRGTNFTVIVCMTSNYTNYFVIAIFYSC